MDLVDLEERPTKKRRFFVEDSPSPESKDAQSPEPLLSDALPETDPHSSQGEEPISEGFDIDLLSSFVGEQLPDDTVQRLKELSGNDLQRGMFIHDKSRNSDSLFNSFKYLSRWIVEDKLPSSNSIQSRFLIIPHGEE
jgi:DNA repair protein RAD5